MNRQNKMREIVIIVDGNDRKIGVEEKLYAHQKGLLHRAFSIYVLNASGEMLLQRRASNKYHSGGLWSNACCGHPLPGENLEQATTRRLLEELGFSCGVKKALHFMYRSSLMQAYVNTNFFMYL